MKQSFIWGFLACIPVVAVSDSFLSPVSFPKTADDLTMQQKRALLTEGYEPFESQFDDKGNCISGCVYQGMNISELDNYLTQKTNEALASATGPADAFANQMPAQTPPEDARTAPNLPSPTELKRPTPTQPTQPTEPTQPTQPTQPAPSQERHCSEFNPDIPIGQQEPWGWPLRATDGDLLVVSHYGKRKINGKQDFHYGVDLRAKYRPVFVPADGTVSNYTTDRACGNGMYIRHANGFQTVYCHLSERYVKPGDKVYAGCLVAKSGNTGGSKTDPNYKISPHLHYGIKKGNDMVDPEPFIKKQK